MHTKYMKVKCHEKLRKTERGVGVIQTEMLPLIRHNLNKDLKEGKEQDIRSACCFPND